MPKLDEIKWIFFDVGSTLVDESKVYEGRMKRIAELADVSYEYVCETAMGFYKENKKGDLETIKLLGVELPKWRFEEYIDLVIASAEEGVSKPDKRIFEIALERSGCKPENAVMVGDRIDNDIVPAKHIGMKTIWVKQGFGRFWNITSNSEKADYEVENLSDILRYL